MQVIETIHNSRTGETSEVSWGNNIASDLSVVQSVVAIIEQERYRKSGESKSPFSERLTTISIHIQL